MKTNEYSRMGLKRVSVESRCAVAKPSIPIAIKGYDVKIFTDNIEETAMEQIKELLSIDVFSDKKIHIVLDVHTGAGFVMGFTGHPCNKIIANIGDTVTIDTIIRPIFNFKAS